MKATHITATWSRLTDDGKLRLHQQRTLDAFSQGANAVINTARTGDGKTLAGLLAGDQLGGRMLMVYPTRELMQDQLESLTKLQERHGLMEGNSWQVINSDTLDEVQEEAKRDGEPLKRAEALRGMLMKRRQSWLTSPDLLDMLLDKRYAGGQNEAKDLGELVAMHTSTIVIDEFHLYDQLQVHKILLCLAHMLVFNPSLRVLLLSATATEEIFSDLEKLGLKIEEVSGEYLDQDEHPGHGWQMILQPVELNYPKKGPKTDEWLSEIALPLKAHLDQQGARALAIFGSLREASLARVQLQQEVGIQPEPITGLTPKSQRTAARRSGRLIVATSTVDVGVDFTISALAFQAWDRSSFIQRFGRLGRGDGKLRDENGQIIGQMPACEAWTDVPLEVGATCTRAELYRAAEKLGGRSGSYGYRRGWGRSLNSLRLMNFRARRDNKPEHAKTLTEKLKALGGSGVYREEGKICINMPKHITDAEGQKVKLLNSRPQDKEEKALQKILQEALTSFRQAPGDVEVALLDLDGNWQRYELMRALKLAEVEFLPTNTKTTLKGAARMPKLKMKAIRYDSLEFDLHHDQRWWPAHHEKPHRPGVRVLKGLTITSDDINIMTWQAQINDALKGTNLVALPLPQAERAIQVSSYFGLGPQADIKLIKDVRGNAMLCACGQTAFITDTANNPFTAKAEPGAQII